jgi:hypothetical protein
VKWLFCIILLIGGVIEFPIRFALNVVVLFFGDDGPDDWIPYLWRLMEKIVGAEIRATP